MTIQRSRAKIIRKYHSKSIPHIVNNLHWSYRTKAVIVYGKVRYAIIADIHANLAAFAAVLEDIERRGGVGEVWCLGDVVGYGPDPHECIELLRQLNHICIPGNHDWAAIGKIDTSAFNPDAARACQWTAQQLTARDILYLENLPLVIERDCFTLAHGSPREPIWEYLLSTGNASESFNYFKTPFCLVGHSHVPLTFKQGEAGECTAVRLSPNVGLVLGRNRMIINPGGVGQPRDGDPRAAYAIYDDEASILRPYRVEYDITVTQARMMRHNLPMRLVARLSHGM
ncbi:metallophosphoesterase family protein [Chloroflexota bacterium]